MKALFQLGRDFMWGPTHVLPAIIMMIIIGAGVLYFG